MDNIFQYAFMQRAFVVAAIIAVIAPCIGVSIVLKRLSAIGDATSHSALAGIEFGLLLGINPILGAVMFSIFAVIGIEVFRKSFGKYSEIATVVVMSAGIGLTAVLSGFITNGSTNINSFLFGSIVAINDFELYLTIIRCFVHFKPTFESMLFISSILSPSPFTCTSHYYNQEYHTQKHNRTSRSEVKIVRYE